MLTICSIASSWPMIIRRRLASSDMASRPVLDGSNGIFSRTILSTAFLTFAPLKLVLALSNPPADCLSAGFHKLSGNPSAIFLDVLRSWRIRLQHLSFRLGRPNLYPANQSSFWHGNEHPDNFGDILRLNLPFLAVGRRMPAEFGGDATGHDVTDTNVVITLVKHHGFAETVHSEFRRIVGRAAREGIFSREATNVDDITPARGSRSETRKRLARAIKRAVEVGLNHAKPVLDR